MGWDYLDDVHLPSSKTHQFQLGRWKKIQVQIGKRDKYVSLTREEWKQLQTFLSKHEFDKPSEIDLKKYTDLAPKVLVILADWWKAAFS